MLSPQYQLMTAFDPTPSKRAPLVIEANQADVISSIIKLKQEFTFDLVMSTKFWASSICLLILLRLYTRSFRDV